MSNRPISSGAGDDRTPASGASQVFVSDLSQHVPHNGTRASGTAPLSLSATAAAWSYLLEFPAPQADQDRVGLYVVEIRGRALEGTIAAGTLARDGVTFHDEQVFAGNVPVSMELAAGLLEHCRGVVVRTVESRPAAAEIASVRWRRVQTGYDGFFAAAPRPELVAVHGWNRYYGVHGDAVERLRGACYDALDAPRVMPWLFGLRIVIQPKEQMSRAVFVSGLYEPATMIALRRLVTQDAVVIDAGANVGLLALACAAWTGANGRVLAFEPSSREFGRLAEHVRLNGFDQLEIHQHALGAEAGTQELKVAESRYSGLNTLGSTLAYDGVAVAAIERVEVLTIDGVVARRRLTRLDVIKLDVEGAELEVLRGAADTIRRFRPVIVFEALASALASHGRTTRELSDFINSLGYDLFRITESGGTEPARAADGDAENLVAVPRA